MTALPKAPGIDERPRGVKPGVVGLDGRLLMTARGKRPSCLVKVVAGRTHLGGRNLRARWEAPNSTGLETCRKLGVYVFSHNSSPLFI
jgi:hypothetical protein